MWVVSLFFQNADDLPVILCKYPFVMDLKSKKLVFDMNSAFTQVTSPPCYRKTIAEFVIFQSALVCISDRTLKLHYSAVLYNRQNNHL